MILDTNKRFGLDHRIVGIIRGIVKPEKKLCLKKEIIIVGF